MTDNSQHLAVLDTVESTLKNIEEQGREVIDFETDEGYVRAKELKKPLVKLRNEGDKARLAATKWHREEQARINELWKGIAARIEAVETPLTAGIKRIDDEAKRVKAELEASEQKRISDIQERIADIRAAAGNAITLDDVEQAISRYNNVTLESFDEFAEEAEHAIAVMDTGLSAKRIALYVQADEAARIEAQRVEQEAQQRKLDEQQAEQQRIADEQAAKLKAQQDEIDRQKRELEKAKEAEVRRAAIADAEQKAKAKAEREKAEALAQAEKDKAAAVETARLKAIEDEQKRIEAEKLREAEDQAERERLAAMAPDAEKLAAWFESIPALPGMTSKPMLVVANRIDELIGEIEKEVKAINTRSKLA